MFPIPSYCYKIYLFVFVIVLIENQLQGKCVTYTSGKVLKLLNINLQTLMLNLTICATKTSCRCALSDTRIGTQYLSRFKYTSLFYMLKDNPGFLHHLMLIGHTE